MKQCLNCKTEFDYKRDTAKFCSDKCRAAWNRANPDRAVTKFQMQALYNEMIELARKMHETDNIRVLPPLGSHKAAALHNAEYSDQHTTKAVLSYNQLQELIGGATSSMELHKAWKQVESNKELVSWQLRELGKLKEYQRTKIDF